jgi:hypothetical protein
MRLQFVHPPRLSPFDRLLRLAVGLPHLDVRILDCRYLGDRDQVRFLLQLRFRRMGLRRVRRLVEEAGLKVEAGMVGPGRSLNSILVSSISRGCGFCRALAGSGCFLTNAWVDCSTRRVVWQLLCGVEEREKLIGSLEHGGLRYSVEYSGSPWGLCLTRRQEAALRLAYNMGFFDQPRRVSTRHLADALGVTPAAASKLVRSGLRRLVEGVIYPPATTSSPPLSTIQG